MGYSQGNEEEVILNYFGDFKGVFLSIGENNGIDLSNVRQLAVDGWSNEIYSWGIEDDEMRQNIINSGLKVTRRKGYFRCEDHERDIVPHEFEKNKRLLLEGRKDDGLSNCSYKLLSTEQKEGYIHIKVIL